MQQTRQQTLPVSPRKRPKTMKNDTRQPFLAPFRADRATAVLGIVVRMTVDDLRQKAEAAARGMSVNVWSAFLAETRCRAKIATWVARFGRDLPSHHVVHGRRFGGCVEEPGASNGRIGQPRGAEIESLNIARLLHLSGQIFLIPQLRALKQLKCSSHNTLPLPIPLRFSAAAAEGGEPGLSRLLPDRD